jgi:L-asparaginase
MKITMLTTGGTIEKTYDERDGSLRNARTTLPQLLSTFRLPDLEISTQQVLFVDSLEMTAAHRETILSATTHAMSTAEAVIILHGTDTLEKTGELLHERLLNLRIPIILTGAMRPYEFRDTDAAQNVTESLLAARLVEPGVYAVMHNRVLQFPGVRKNREQLTFEASDQKSNQLKI